MRAPRNDIAEWDTWAESYGKDVDWLNDIHDDALLERIAVFGRRVLDVGCGTGRLAARLIAAGANVTAADYSAAMLAQARRRLKDHPHATLLRWDIEASSLALAQRYDVVIAQSLLHHFDKPASAVEHLRQAVAEGGALAIMDPLSKRSLLDYAAFWLKLLRRAGTWRCARGFTQGLLPPSLRRAHQRREVLLGFEDFRERYRLLLPGATAQTLNGVYGLLLWTRQTASQAGQAS